MKDALKAGQMIRGNLRAETALQVSENHNQIQFGWGAAASRLLATGDKAYRISTMYIEFENCDNPGDVVTVPDYTRDAGREYYEQLSGSDVRDFLRVSLLAPAVIAVETGFEEIMPAGEGNQLTFYTQTQGVAGYHGLPFSHAQNSKVVGAALVVSPVPVDPTKDIIVARGYLPTDGQVLKLAAGHVGLTWRISLT